MTYSVKNEPEPSLPNQWKAELVEAAKAKELAAAKAKEPIRYVDNQNYTPSPSMKKEVIRAVAAVCTLGMSELLVAGGEGLNKLRGKAILAAFNKYGELDPKSRKKDLEEFEAQKHPNDCLKLEVTTADGAKLDGRMIKPTGDQKPGNEQKYVIWLNGSGGSYEAKLNDAVEYANRSGATILMFNYRGMGDSTGTLTGAKDLVKDTLAMVNFLTDQGATEANITIHGYSMGGGIGAQAASQREEVQFISDRSFTALSKSVKDVVAAGTLDYIGGAASKALGSIAGSIVKHSDYELNTQKLYENKDSAKVDSLVQRTLVLYHPKDEMISPQASLATSHSVKDETKAKLAERTVNLESGSTVRDVGKRIFFTVGAEPYDKFVARKKLEDSSRTDQQIDILYRDELLMKITNKVNLLHRDKPDQAATYDRLMSEAAKLRDLDLENQYSIHLQSPLDFPVADKVINFVKGDQRFPVDEVADALRLNDDATGGG